MKAMLVYSSFVTRVIVDDDATEDEIIQSAKSKMIYQVNAELGENIEDISEDTEIPYDPKTDVI